MNIDETVHEGIPLLRISGDLDHLAAPQVQEGIDHNLDAGEPALLLDLTEVPFVDSGGLNVLLRTVLRLGESSGWLGVVGANSSLMRVFTIVGLTSRDEFRSFADLSEVRPARCQ